MAASHTHGAPVIQDQYKDGPPAWERTALEKIERAIQEATTGLAEARIGTGMGETYIGHNRLRVNADGSVSWFERNLTRVPTAPVDPTVSVIRIDRADGSAMAILTHYSCHPVVFGSDNLQYTADFPGVMNRVVEEKFGSRAVSFFLQGAPGDINPYYAVTPIQEDAVKARDWTGERLGVEAARVAAEIHSQPAAEPSIQFSEEMMPVRLRWNEDKFRQALGEISRAQRDGRIRTYQIRVSDTGGHGAHQPSNCHHDRAGRTICRFSEELERPLPGACGALARLHQRLLRILSDDSSGCRRRLRSGERGHVG